MKSLKIILVLAVLAFAFSGLTTTNDATNEVDRVETEKAEYDKVVLKRKKGGQGSNA